LFDGKDEEEADLFGTFVLCIFQVYSQVRASAEDWMNKRVSVINLNITNHQWSKTEAGKAIEKLEEISTALTAVDELLGNEENSKKVAQAGLKVEFGTDADGKALTLTTALTHRMKLNILRTKGIQGGDETGKPISTGDADRQDVQRTLEDEVAQQTGQARPDDDEAERQQAQQHAQQGVGQFVARQTGGN
jgi:hypothetical protein